MSPAAAKYISRQPKSSPTTPLTTREARIPVSKPERTIPTLRFLYSGREYCAASGMKICGMTEQTPVTSENP